MANTDFTLNAWVKPDSYNPSFYSGILSKRTTGTNNGWFWAINGTGTSPAGAVSYIPGAGGTGAVSTGIVAPGAWHMITSIYSLASSQLDIYIDGVLSNTVTGISSANASATALMYIGRDDPSIGTSYFKGAMNDIRIYNRAINTAEINALYVAPDAPTAGLIAYWPLCNTARDCSGHAHHGTAGEYTYATTDRFGNPIGAYYFNGFGLVDVPDSPELRLANTDFTINAWVTVDSYSADVNNTILTKRGADGNMGWYEGIRGVGGSPFKNPVIYSPGGGEPSALGTQSILPLNTWHMVTCIYHLSTQQLDIYVDGVLDNTTTGILSPNAGITARLIIGRDPSSPIINPWAGNIDDIRIYNRAVNTAEISQLYGCLN